MKPLARIALALLAGLIAGGGAFAQPAPLQVSIHSPAAAQSPTGAWVDRVFTAIAVTSGPLEVVEVTATVGTVTTPLAFSAAAYCEGFGHFCYPGWKAQVDLGALPEGPHTLVVTARDASGASASASRAIRFDRAPVVTVQSPAEGDVARPHIRVRASCTDTSGPCTAIRVTSGCGGASRTQSLDVTLDLSTCNGREIALQVTGTDAAGVEATVVVGVFVEGGERLREVARAPGVVWDADASRILHTLEGNTIAIRDRATGGQVTVYSDPTAKPVRARLTQAGAAVLGAVGSSLTGRLVSWEAGGAVELGEAHRDSLVVAGRYLIWLDAGQAVHRRDVVSGTTTTVGPNDNDFDNDVAADGSVAYAELPADNGGATVWLVSPSGTRSPIAPGSAQWSHYKPRTDGTGVLFLTSGVNSGMPPALNYFRGGVTHELVVPWAFSSYDYGVANGWVAFSKRGPSGVSQVWRLRPSGQLEQLTFFSNASTLEVLADNGSVTLWNAGRRYLVGPDDTRPVDISNPWGRMIFLDGTAHLALGTSLLRVEALPLAASPSRLDFGLHPTRGSASRSIVLSNHGPDPVTVTSIAISGPFSVQHDCGTLAPGAGCVLAVVFRPPADGGHLGEIILDSSAGQLRFALSGWSDPPLVGHYYRTILGRPADSGGLNFWTAEAPRVTALGASVNETWYAMSAAFFSSQEYAARKRDNAGFVTDLYQAFFNRAPDAAGLSFWTGQLGSGMPREVALASFMFSPEFVQFTTAIFGAQPVRTEIDLVMDFYRGLLGRLPDNGGFTGWRNAFRTAQCSGPQAVLSAVDDISAAFPQSPEYAARARSNAQYVGDLYNAFLRRGGDLEGALYWIGRIDSGAMTREEVRRAFLQSAEFMARVQRVAAETCLPP